MTDKLCPFDKKPCIGRLCMIWAEPAGRCGLCTPRGPEEKKPLPPDLAEETLKKKRQSRHGDGSSKYRVELFD